MPIPKAIRLGCLCGKNFFSKNRETTKGTININTASPKNINIISKNEMGTGDSANEIFI